MNSLEWFSKQAKLGFPLFKRGDILLSYKKDSVIPKLIGFFQARSEQLPIEELFSHGLFYNKNGFGIEATFPKGGKVSIAKYLAKDRHTIIYRPRVWTEGEINAILSWADLLGPRPYETEKFALHLFDNFIERLTIKNGRGWTPFQRWIPDGDLNRRNHCTGMMGWSIALGLKLTTERKSCDSYINPKLKVGAERPYDFSLWCKDKVYCDYIAESMWGEI